MLRVQWPGLWVEQAPEAPEKQAWSRESTQRRESQAGPTASTDVGGLSVIDPSEPYSETQSETVSSGKFSRPHPGGLRLRPPGFQGSSARARSGPAFHHQVLMCLSPQQTSKLLWAEVCPEPLVSRGPYTLNKCMSEECWAGGPYWVLSPSRPSHTRRNMHIPCAPHARSRPGDGDGNVPLCQHLAPSGGSLSKAAGNPGSRAGGLCGHGAHAVSRVFSLQLREESPLAS